MDLRKFLDAQGLVSVRKEVFKYAIGLCEGEGREMELGRLMK